MTRRRKAQAAHGLTWDTAKENVLVWLIAAMVSYGTYNLHKLTESVTRLNNQITKVVTVNSHHAYRLDQQHESILKIQEVNTKQDVAIGRLEAIAPKQ